MKLKRLLTSRSPSTVWLLEPDRLSVVRRDRKGGLQSTSAAMTAGVVETGVVGLQAVDVQRLAAHLQPLNDRLAGARRAAVVVPTSWVRIHILEFDHLPRRAADLAEVVRWRLKKLLPVAPAELRIAMTPAPSAGSHRVLCVSTLEHACADLEAAFGAVGVQPGLVAPRLFVLAGGSLPNRGPRLVVQHEAGFLSLLLTTEERPRLLRTKPLPATDEAWQLTLRELHLTAAYIRDNLAVDGELTVAPAAETSEITEELARWWSQQEGVRLEESPLPPCPTAEGDQLEAGRLRLACSVLTRGVAG